MSLHTLSYVGFNATDLDDWRQYAIGVLGMQERAQLLQGAFRIESSPGEGAMLVFEMPAKAGVCHEQ